MEAKTYPVIFCVVLVIALLSTTADACSELSARRRISALLQMYPNLTNEVCNGSLGGGSNQTSQTAQAVYDRLPDDEKRKLIYVPKSALKEVSERNLQKLKEKELSQSGKSNLQEWFNTAANFQ